MRPFSSNRGFTQVPSVVSVYCCLSHQVVSEVHGLLVCITAVYLFIHQTSYRVLLLSDVVTLGLSLVGQGAVTHQPSLIIGAPWVPIHELILAQSCGSLCALIRLDKLGGCLSVFCEEQA